MYCGEFVKNYNETGIPSKVLQPQHLSPVFYAVKHLRFLPFLQKENNFQSNCLRDSWFCPNIDHPLVPFKSPVTWVIYVATH